MTPDDENSYTPHIFHRLSLFPKKLYRALDILLFRFFVIQATATAAMHKNATEPSTEARIVTFMASTGAFDVRPIGVRIVHGNVNSFMPLK